MNKEEIKINFEMNAAEAEVVVNALGNLPLNQVGGLHSKLVQSAQKQIDAIAQGEQKAAGPVELKEVKEESK